MSPHCRKAGNRGVLIHENNHSPRRHTLCSPDLPAKSGIYHGNHAVFGVSASPRPQNRNQGGKIMRKLIKLENDFHGTDCNVRVRQDGTLSAKQVKNAWLKLCGSPHCTCSDAAGCRPTRVIQVSRDRYRLID